MFKVLKDFERKEDQNNNLIYEQYSLPVSTNKIKCIKYGSNNIVILTKFNELYIYKTKYNAFIKQTFLKEDEKINHVECGDDTIIVVNNYNQFYEATITGLKSCGIFNRLGEIVNCIYKSFHDHTLISTNLNNLYFTGINTGNKFNLGSSGNLDNISNFKKLDYIKIDKQFIYPLLLQNFFFIISNHKFKNEEEELNQIQLNLLKSLQNKNCCDLEFDVKEEKKRKRHDFENQIY
ncbi:hypothetical protein ABK040_011183 [Willaertia magna]